MMPLACNARGINPGSLEDANYQGGDKLSSVSNVYSVTSLDPRPFCTNLKEGHSHALKDYSY
jgi:hypothetical protein